MTTEAETLEQARDLSARNGETTLKTWVYAITYPSGCDSFWIRCTREVEHRVSGINLKAVAAYLNGVRVWPC